MKTTRLPALILTALLIACGGDPGDEAPPFEETVETTGSALDNSGGPGTSSCFGYSNPCDGLSPHPWDDIACSITCTSPAMARCLDEQCGLRQKWPARCWCSNGSGVIP